MTSELLTAHRLINHIQEYKIGWSTNLHSILSLKKGI